MTKIIFAALCALAGFQLFISPFQSVAAESLEEQLTRIEKDIAAIRKNKQDLNSQIQSQRNQIGVYSGQIGQLRGEMESLQLDIAELDLQIKELDVNIQLLDQEVGEKEESIEENTEVITTLEDITRERIENDYMDYRARGSVNIDFLPSEDPNTYFKDAQYKSLIQEQTNQDIDKMIELKIQLEEDRAKLTENLIQVARSKAIVDEQSTQLDRAKQDLQSKIDGYYQAVYQAQANINRGNSVLGAYSDEEAKKQAKAEMIRQELFRQFNSIPAGQYVLAGTQIGNQGSTGWSTGPHLHFSVSVNGAVLNPCGFLPGGFVAGCGGNGSLQAPLRGTYYYTSGFYSGVGNDLRCFGAGNCHAHPAIDVAHSIWNAPIYAAHDGWLVKGVDQYGALYIILCQNRTNCNSGFKTGYWHLSAY